MTDTSTPQLAPPGAGVPWVEQALGRRIVMPMMTALIPVEGLLKQVQLAASDVERLISGFDDTQLAQRHLIKRLAYLEDSSRYWSMAMTLEHMAIVNTDIARLIGLLLNGKGFDREVRTADVKPQSKMSVQESKEFFVRSLQAVEKAVSGVNADQWRNSSKWSHPWFGSMQAKGWLVLAFIHTRLHTRQLLAIKAQLAKK